MARADLLLDLVRAGARGDQSLFRKSLEALEVLRWMRRCMALEPDYQAAPISGKVCSGR